METNAVTKVVTDEISITAKFISDLKMFAITKGLDLVEAIILFIIGYILCRYIRKAAEHILEKSNVDPSAKTFISEIIFFFCLAIVAIVALGTAGVVMGCLGIAKISYEKYVGWFWPFLATQLALAFIAITVLQIMKWGPA